MNFRFSLAISLQSAGDRAGKTTPPSGNIGWKPVPLLIQTTGKAYFGLVAKRRCVRVASAIRSCHVLLGTGG